MEPKSSIPFSIDDRKDGYAIKLDSNLDDEEVYASVTITDTSSSYKVPDYKHNPSLQTQVYLEREIRQIDGEIDEFDYS